ncbi:LicD family protein [Streptococcus danieliae]|uniref:LicD family protein n=1 Tax=Streptococcus danieliae TaxID=747656 RepID=UPI0021C98772|nr:LicD family protein [Streptococcus danieliae]MCU0082026.1 LicD family protein [Streptococcus danieliae]
MQEEFTLAKIQELELGILEYIKTICEKYGLRYYLAYGSLIGAVRHQGFIPWDDDIDIMMPRKDYQLLLGVLEKEPHPYYKLISMDTDPRFQVPLPKMIDTRTVLTQKYDLIEPVPLGVYVDLFLMDGAGDNYDQAVQQYDEAFQLYQYWKKSRLSFFPPSMSKVRGLLRWVKNLGYKLIGSQYFMDKLTAHNCRFDFYQSKYVATFETGTSQASKCIWHVDDFGEGTFLEFCGSLYPVPKSYDKVLKSEYGDYMTLPPKEKQVSHHSYTLKWKANKTEL